MTSTSSGKLLDHLPAIYHASDELAEILAIFESVLFGPLSQSKTNRESTADFPSILEHINDMSSFFDIHDTPTNFLPWLAQWVALIHLDGLNETQQRKLLAEIVPLYAERGTKKYLEKLLRFFIRENASAEIDDTPTSGFIVGNSEIGVNSWLQKEKPFWFQITILLDAAKTDELQVFKEQWEKRIRKVIDLSKPAHTLYELNWKIKEKKAKGA